jgi:predicted DNA-binding transcriptional regulator AlpA
MAHKAEAVIDSGVPALLIDSRAASAVLAIGERRLWELTNNGAVPSLKIGKSRRYCPEELKAWIRAGCPVCAGAAERIRKENSR